MVILKNVTKRLVTYNLAGDHMRETKTHGYKQIKTVTVDHLANGDLLPRIVKKSVPESLTLPAETASGSLPNEVLQCPEVKGAIARRELRIMAQSDDAEQNAEAPAAPDDTGDDDHDVK